MRVGPSLEGTGYPEWKGNLKLWDRQRDERGSFGIVGRLEDK